MIQLFRIFLIGSMIVHCSVVLGESTNALPTIQPASSFRIAVKDTSTRVLVANVFLEIGSLRYEEGYLVGNYSLEVPIRPAKSEGGSMRLKLPKNIDGVLREGGTLEGIGTSFKEDKPPRIIVCEVIPCSDEKGSGTIELAIDVGDRIIEFSSTYQAMGEIPARELSMVLER